MRITCLLECEDIMHAAESDSRIGYTVYAKELKKIHYLGEIETKF